MKQYQDAVRHVLANGTRKENRTGVDTLSTFGYYYEVDLAEGFPLLTTKNVSWKNIVVELLWFLSGQTDIAILKRHGCKFWDAWADPDTGKVPSAYGNFWRKFPVHRQDDPKSPAVQSRGSAISPDFNDQIAWVLAEMRRNPMSRRMVVSAWAPGNAQTSKLPPCHCLYVFNVQNADPTPRYVHYGHNRGEDPVCGNYNDGRRVLPHGEGMKYREAWCPDCQVLLNGARGGDVFKNPPVGDDPRRLCLHLTQRSLDVMLGAPYNLASYALLIELFSRFTGIKPGIFGHSVVDMHIYCAKPDGSMAEYDHTPGAREQLTREPRLLPRLIIDDSIKDLSDIERLMDPSVTTEEIMGLFRLEGYNPHPAINFKVAV